MTEIHEPVRILFVIETKPERFMRILDRNPTLARLFGNEWILAATLDPDSTDIHFFRDGRFEPHIPEASEIPKSIPRWIGTEVGADISASQPSGADSHETPSPPPRRRLMPNAHGRPALHDSGRRCGGCPDRAARAFGTLLPRRSSLDGRIHQAIHSVGHRHRLLASLGILALMLLGGTRYVSIGWATGSSSPTSIFISR